jgi:superfamily II DNA or RNA helicase
MKLRDFQVEDYNAVLSAHRQHQCVIGQAATGLGKSVLLARIAEHYLKTGRVIALVDTIKLAQQLVETFEKCLGEPVGIERGDSEARNESPMQLEFDREHRADKHRVIVATVQTLYSGNEGHERVRKFDPSEFSLLELDEAELYFPRRRSRMPVDYFLTNPKLRCLGVTATPFRTDRIGYRNLFQSLAFTRDRRWGEQNGWLVHPNQGFVRVSLDFSTLKLNKNKWGERDYSEEQIAETLNNRDSILELSRGILDIAGDRKSIIVCPAGKDKNGPAAIARMLAFALEQKQPGCAKCIYGNLGDTERDDVFDGHRRGEFQFMTAVSMINKGYNDPSIRAVFVCRKTRSKRLYQQIVGRGVRTWEDLEGRGIVEGLETAAQRVAAIASSPKPDVLIANMVGVDGSVRDCTLVDLDGKIESERVVQRAKQLVEEGADTDDAIEQAEAEEDEQVEEARVEAAAAQAQLEAAENQSHERAILSSVEIRGSVEMEMYDDDRITHGGSGTQMQQPGGLSPSSYRVLKNCGYPDSVIEARGKVLNRWLFGRFKKKLVTSYKQIQFLRRLGAEDSQIKNMTKDQADAFIKERLRR